jgi:hypothetical protein
MASVFSGTMEFLAQLGVFEVVLPFILTFVMIYAILEKTKILGTEADGKSSRKNLNALLSFCIGFFVIASSSIVAVINQAMAQIVLLALVSICFMLLVGSFSRNGEDVFLEGKWKKGFMIFMLVGVILVFAGAIKLDGKNSILDYIYIQITQNFTSNAVSAIALIAIVVGVVYWVSSEAKPAEEKKK